MRSTQRQRRARRQRLEASLAAHLAARPRRRDSVCGDSHARPASRAISRASRPKRVEAIAAGLRPRKQTYMRGQFGPQGPQKGPKRGANLGSIFWPPFWPRAFIFNRAGSIFGSVFWPLFWPPFLAPFLGFFFAICCFDLRSSLQGRAAPGLRQGLYFPRGARQG